MIKIQDIAYVAYRAPDLDKMESFLTDFGLTRADRTDDRLYMRGAGPYPYNHVTEKGDSGFVSCGLVAGSRVDLDAVAELDGASSVEEIDGPGGGHRVRLAGPSGFRIDIVHGAAPAKDLPVRDPLPLNYAREKNRVDALQRPKREPAAVARLGHCVFKCTDADAGAEWFENNLGMLRSDRLHLPDDEDATLGIFLRCDRGAASTDHHTIFVLNAPDDVKIHHASFEVQDYDAQHIGHEWLRAKGWHHEWGIGRHLLGSQIFDYWRDPWGHMLEHYADGDLLTATATPGDHPAKPENLAQWGPELSPTFFD